MHDSPVFDNSRTARRIWRDEHGGEPPAPRGRNLNGAVEYIRRRHAERAAQREGVARQSAK